MTAQDRRRSIELFEQHHPNQLVRPGRRTKREPQFGLFVQAGRKSVGATDQKHDGWQAISPPFGKLGCKSSAIEIFPPRIEQHDCSILRNDIGECDRFLDHSSAGVGSATHWAAERFLLSAGISATHIPFRGGPEALTEVMTGRVDFCFIGISAAVPFINDGRLAPLAVSTTKRSSALPNVPTTIEAGFPDSDYTFWNGMLVPAKTPWRPFQITASPPWTAAS